MWRQLKVLESGQAGWHEPLIPAPGSPRQEDYEFGPCSLLLRTPRLKTQSLSKTLLSVLSTQWGRDTDTLTAAPSRMVFGLKRETHHKKSDCAMPLT